MDDFDTVNRTVSGLTQLAVENAKILMSQFQGHALLRAIKPIKQVNLSAGSNQQIANDTSFCEDNNIVDL